MSAANEKLSSLIVRAQRKNVEAVDAIKDFYLEHISFHAFLESSEQEKIVSATDSDEGNGSQKTEQNRELARACETVCGVADATFELIVTGALDGDPPEPAPTDAEPVGL